MYRKIKRCVDWCQDTRDKIRNYGILSLVLDMDPKHNLFNIQMVSSDACAIFLLISALKIEVVLLFLLGENSLKGFRGVGTPPIL